MRYQPPTPPRPTPTVMATATLRIIKLVVNRFGGKAVPSDFAITIRRAGSGVQFKPIQGADGAGALINLAPGPYDLSETPTPGYRGVWSGSITVGGRVSITANQTGSVTRTNFDLRQARESSPSPTTEAPLADFPSQVNPRPTMTPSHTINGGALPITATPWNGWLIVGLLLLLVPVLGFYARKLGLRRSFSKKP